LRLIGDKMPAGAKRLSLSREEILFGLLTVVCAVLLLLNLMNMTVLWDETPHLYGGLLLSRGNVAGYFSFTQYPPLVDTLIAAYFMGLGANVFTARLVSVTFALLTLLVLFKLVSKTYNRKIALLSSVLLATMPGFIWLSSLSLIEVTLEFFIVASFLCFVYWLETNKTTAILLSGLLLGLAFLAKYQGLIAGLVMVASLPFVLFHSRFKAKIWKIGFLLIVVSLFVVPVLITLNSSGMLSQWLNLAQGADMQAQAHSQLYPAPVFYLVEVTFPMDYMHPIYLPIFILGLLGLSLFLLRRKAEDRFFLVWFIAVYVFFTLVTMKSWRYAMPLFPVIAVSAASFVAFAYDRCRKSWSKPHLSGNKKLAIKILAASLVGFTAVSAVASTVDAYGWISHYEMAVPLPEAIHYASTDLGVNDSILLVCPVNVFFKDTARFYLQAYEEKNNQILQYPVLPADAYTPEFNITEMLNICQANQVKHILLYEHRWLNYYNSTLNIAAVTELINGNEKFNYEATFGVQPNRIFIFEVNRTAT
jgi:4-amino-4-deoxy-L-arabinose transferase-like glycosyltransferase